jgi:hypothetical protein
MKVKDNGGTTEKKGKEITAAAIRNSKLLSFGDEEEDTDTQVHCKW